MSGQDIKERLRTLALSLAKIRYPGEECTDALAEIERLEKHNAILGRDLNIIAKKAAELSVERVCEYSYDTKARTYLYPGCQEDAGVRMYSHDLHGDYCQWCGGAVQLKEETDE